MTHLQVTGPEPEASSASPMPVDASAAVAGGAPAHPVPLPAAAGAAAADRDVVMHTTRKRILKPADEDDEAFNAAYDAIRVPYRKHLAAGRNDKGTFNEANVERRPVRSRAGERLPQLVKQVSEVILELAGGFEIEAMWVRGVLVVAGNDREQIDRVLGRIAAAMTNPEIAADPSMLHQLLELASPAAQTSARVAKTVVKLQQLQGADPDARDQAWEPSREVPEDLAEYRALRDVLRTQPPSTGVLSIDEARTELEKPAAERQRSVLFLHETDIHAEQQLVRLLALSSFCAERAIIRGSKRPCYGCYLALAYAQEFQGCAGLDHGVRPGGLWLNSVDSALSFIAQWPGTHGSAATGLAWANAKVQKFEGLHQSKSVLKSGKVVADEDSESDSGDEVAVGPKKAKGKATGAKAVGTRTSARTKR